MTRTPLKSTQLKSAGYRADKRELEVELATGQVILYSGVSQALYEGLVRASNPLSYYRDRIEEDFTGRRIS